MTVSVIVPIWNEDARNLRVLYRRLRSAMEGIDAAWELLCVADGSGADTMATLRLLAVEDPRVRVLPLDGHRGQETALVAGFLAADGELLCTLDSDLEQAPEDLVLMLRPLLQGEADLVLGTRRPAPTFSRRRCVLSRIYTAVMNLRWGLRLRDWGCGMNAGRRELVDALREELPCWRGGPLKAALVRVARRWVDVEVTRLPRRFGRSQYNWHRFLIHAVTMVVRGSSCRPLPLPRCQPAAQEGVMDPLGASADDAATGGEGCGEPRVLLETDHDLTAERPMSRHMLTANVSVVIPTTGSSDRLVRCLRSLRQQTQPPGEVTVVTPDLALHLDPLTVRVVTCRPGTTFAGAVNLGIGVTQRDWVFVLNDDVVLDPRFLERLCAGIPSDPRIGMVCGKLLQPDGRTVDSTGQFLTRMRTARERGHGVVDRGQWDAPGEVFSVPGAAALYRRHMLEALAVSGTFFDEDFGMYLEDLDLGWRAQRAGWRASYVPDAVGVHRRGATAKTRPPRWRWLRRYYLPWLCPELQARYVVNRYRLMAKHDTRWRLLTDSPWILWYELRLWAYLLCCEPQTLRILWREARRGKEKGDVSS